MQTYILYCPEMISSRARSEGPDSPCIQLLQSHPESSAPHGAVSPASQCMVHRVRGFRIYAMTLNYTRKQQNQDRTPNKAVKRRSCFTLLEVQAPSG